MRENESYLALLKFKNENPISFWIILIYLAFITFYTIIYLAFFSDHSRLLPINELGDYLAGVFAPLAFFFLYLGYKQNTQALKIQSEELRLSNESLKQQVEEMSKSVKAQQDMFNLTEQQYFEAKEDRVKKNKPNLQLILSNYYVFTDRFPNMYKFTLDLNILNNGLSLMDLTIKSNFWSMLLNGTGTMSENLVLSNLAIENGDRLYIKLFRLSDETPFHNNTLTLTYKDVNGVKYCENYQIKQNINDIEAINIQ